MTKPDLDFTWVETDEPHATRRKAILAKHPEIKQLFGKEPLTMWVVFGIFCLQMFMAYHIRNYSNFVLILAAWAIGGTVNHTLQLAVHELSHNLAFPGTTPNKILAIFANLPTGVPSAMTFIPYHMEHHQNQGVDGIDVDIPSMWEVNLFNNSTIMKLIWTFFQPFFYALRPLVCKPRENKSNWEIVNYVVIFAWDAFIWYKLGGRSLAYLVSGSLLGLGLHPCAGHFIAEHYEFIKGTETYSYYGPCNFFNLNVGYHNEHHDFPKVPWTKLPKVREMAPEFYEDLPHYTSYLYVFWKFITDPTIGPYSRVKRATRQPSKAKAAKSVKAE